MKHSFGKPPDGVSGQRRREKPSGNEAIIRAAMKDRGIRGNPKDYVLLLEGRLLDCSGSYAMFKVNDDKTEAEQIEIEGIQLVHKKNLHKFAADPVAEKFWNRKLGVRIPQIKKKEKRLGK